MAYSPWGCKELDTTDQLTLSFLKTVNLKCFNYKKIIGFSMQLTSILYHLSQWLQSSSVKGQSKVDWGTWMTSEMEQSLLNNRHYNLQTSPGWSLRTETPSQGKLQDLPLQVPHWEGEPNTRGHNCWLKLGNVFLESRAPRQGAEKSFKGSVVTRTKG